MNDKTVCMCTTEGEGEKEKSEHTALKLEYHRIRIHRLKCVFLKHRPRVNVFRVIASETADKIDDCLMTHCNTRAIVIKTQNHLQFSASTQQDCVHMKRKFN